MESSGKKFKKLVNENKPLQIVGTVNAYSAIMAEKVGHQSIYLSGGGVAASSLGVPDLGITSRLRYHYWLMQIQVGEVHLILLVVFKK